MNEDTLERTIYKLIERAGSIFGNINWLYVIKAELDEGVSYYREKEIKDYVQSNMKYAKESAEELIKIVTDFEKEMEMTIEKELLPCPFCGSPAEYFERVDDYGFITSKPGMVEHVIECSNKKCPIFLEASGETYEKAALRWNTRANEGEKQ